MMDASKQAMPPIRFYSGFLETDWPRLRPDVQEALVEFLVELQRNPLNPELLQRVQSNGKYLAYEFANGYWVYWKLVTEKPGSFITLESSRPVRIEVLEVRAI